MRHSRLSFLLAALFSAVYFCSCLPQKEVTTHQQQLAVVDSQLAEHSRKLKELDVKRQHKHDQNEMGDTASARIQKFIGLTNAEIEKLLAQNSILVGNTSVSRDDWNRLKKALILSQGTSKLIGDKVSLITDLINRNTVVRLEQDVIFGPGQYNLTPVVAASISRMFDPVAKEIDYFINKYPDFPLSLVITARGYADATTIGDGSNLYKKLKDRLKLNTPNPSSEELNKELSVARAESVTNLLKTFTLGKARDGSNVKNLLFLHEGKGERFPDPKVSDYKTDDPRRRIVLLFWSIFPE